MFCVVYFTILIETYHLCVYFNFIHTLITIKTTMHNVVMCHLLPCHNVIEKEQNNISKDCSNSITLQNFLCTLKLWHLFLLFNPPLLLVGKLDIKIGGFVNFIGQIMFNIHLNNL